MNQSVWLRWTLRFSFLFVLGGAILTVVGAAIYFPNANSEATCTVLANNDVVQLLDGAYYGLVDCNCTRANPIGQSNVRATVPYTSFAEALNAVAGFAVLSTFQCSVADSGLITGPFVQVQ
jgi:hypothetical protein